MELTKYYKYIIYFLDYTKFELFGKQEDLNQYIENHKKISVTPILKITRQPGVNRWLN